MPEEEEEGGGFSGNGYGVSLQDLLLHLVRDRCTRQLDALLMFDNVLLNEHVASAVTHSCTIHHCEGFKTRLCCQIFIFSKVLEDVMFYDRFRQKKQQQLSLKRGYFIT